MSFSPIGDALALARLFKEIVNAVNDYVDAKEDYQHTVSNLEAIEAISDCFRNLRVTSANQSVINSIRAQAHTAATEIRRARDHIESYRSCLGPHNSQPYYRDAFARLKWAQVAKASHARLAKVDLVVKDSTRNIHLLLQMHQINASSEFRISTTAALSSLDTAMLQQAQTLHDIGQRSLDSSMLHQQMQDFSKRSNDASQDLLRQAAGISARVESASECQLRQMRQLADTLSHQIAAESATQQASIFSSIDSAETCIRADLNSVAQDINSRLPPATQIIALPPQATNTILIFTVSDATFDTLHVGLRQSCFLSLRAYAGVNLLAISIFFLDSLTKGFIGHRLSILIRLSLLCEVLVTYMSDFMFILIIVTGMEIRFVTRNDAKVSRKLEACRARHCRLLCFTRTGHVYGELLQELGDECQQWRRIWRLI